MVNYLKLYLIRILRVVLRLFYVFPVKNNRILFSSSEGSAYNCNPKYIYIGLKQRWGDKLEYVWCLNNREMIPKTEKVKTIKFLSLGHIYYLLTSKVIVSNLGIEPFIPKRKQQLFINTWHGGGAYKDGGINSSFISKSRTAVMLYMRDVRGRMTDYLISSCQAFTDVYSKKFCIPNERVLNIGLPRNDVFFEKLNLNLRKDICKEYGIDEKSMIILYAPTFRGNWRDVKNIDLKMNVSFLKAAVKKRFNKDSVVLFRLHRFMGVKESEGTIDVSAYQDMQNLLYVSDILITDYSSSIWDFSLTYKPGFLFTPDIEKYEEETSFHTPIREWQYPIARDMDELCFNILRYDKEKAIERIKKHHKEMGSFEKGTATHTVCDIISNWCNY